MLVMVFLEKCLYIYRRFLNLFLGIRLKILYSIGVFGEGRRLGFRYFWLVGFIGGIRGDRIGVI